MCKPESSLTSTAGYIQQIYRNIISPSLMNLESKPNFDTVPWALETYGTNSFDF